MRLSEYREKITVDSYSEIFDELKYKLRGRSVTRFVVASSNENEWECETGEFNENVNFPSIFDFNKRRFVNNNEFNVALVVPTGIGVEFGGHAGDAGPVAKLLAQSCDNLITHPNVVNASDINEMPDNALYAEGSVISGLLMGNLALQKVRSNRVILAIDNHKDDYFTNAAINSLNAAVATYGLDCTKVVKMEPPLKMGAVYSSSGRATGIVEQFESLQKVVEDNRGEFDALAISSVIKVPVNYHMDYIKSEGEMVNPWGGVESLLTHGTSLLYNIPSAHSPMFENQDIANFDPGLTEPRLAAESVSLSFLQCILKGLQKSPKIVTDPNLHGKNGVLSANDLSALVIPDGCIGLPTLAAMKQGMTVIAVRDSSNIMDNDLEILPWGKGQLIKVSNYLEASGVLNAMKSGVCMNSVRRPLSTAEIEVSTLDSKNLKEETVYKNADTGLAIK